MGLIPIQVVVDESIYGRASMQATEAPGVLEGVIIITGEDGLVTLQHLALLGNLQVDGDVAVTGNFTQGSGLRLGSSSFSVAAADLVDGGAAIGTYSPAIPATEIPEGAVPFASVVRVQAGFTGDVSAVIQLGDGTDADRYNTGTPSVFATAATGIQTGVVSGEKLVTTAHFPVVTITSATDIGLVITEDAGALTVSILYVMGG